MTKSISTTPHGAIFLGSEGGGGHNAAREALLKRYLVEKYISWTDFQKNPTRDGIRVLDMMTDILDRISLPSIGKLGTYSKNQWNSAQESGNIASQIALINRHWLGEKFFYPIIYREVKQMLLHLEVEPEVFVSTQALCTDAIAKAIREVNQERGWNLQLDVHMTDMPTKQASHFFHSLQKVRKYSDIVRLHVPPPKLSKKMESDSDFWKKYASGINVISGEDFPIRKKFLEQRSQLKTAVDLKLKVHPSSLDEVKIIKSGLTEALLENFEDAADNLVEFPISEKDKVATLMLGSKPSKPAVIAYLKMMIDLAREKEEAYQHALLEYQDARDAWQFDPRSEEPTPPGGYYFFLFTGRPESIDSENILLREIKSILENTDLPENLNIVPFTFQSDEELAPLMARSDATLTRSGGLSTMELLHLNRNEKRLTLIHSEGMHPTQNSSGFFQDKVEAIQFLILFIFDFLFDKLGWEMQALLEDPEIVEGLILKIQGIYPEASKEEIEKIIKDPLNKANEFETTKFLPLLRKIYNDPAIEDDQHIKKMIKRLKTKIKNGDHDLTPDDQDMRRKAIERLLVKNGIPCWEGGNAKYMMETIGAKIISSDHCKETLKKEFFTLHK